MDNYLASCAYTFTALNYGILDGFANQLRNDCALNFNEAERALSAVYCSSAFDHIVGYVESALNPAVVVAGGVMTTPYSCALATAVSCPQACVLPILAASSPPASEWRRGFDAGGGGGGGHRSPDCVSTDGLPHS